MRVENNVFPPEVQEAVLFPFDDSSIPLTYGLQLGLVQGRRQGILVRPGKPGMPDCRRVRYYGTVIRNGEEFRMWYLGLGDQDDKYRVCYAISQDGIKWEKPTLGLVEYGGSTQNNLVDLLNGEYSVVEAPIIYDSEDPDPARRFKMAFESEKYQNRLAVAFSPDGLHWKESSCNPVTKHMLEQSGVIKFNGCYYVNGQLGGPRPGALRQMVTYMSYDFEHWTEATALSFRRDVEPPPEGSWNAGEQVHLGASLWNRGNVIIGFYGMWHGHESDDRRLVTMDLGLIVSNDVIHFKEPIPGFKLIPCYEEPETASGIHGLLGAALAQGQGFENVGEQTLYWYEVWNQGQVRLATWPRDRFGYYKVYREGRRQMLEEPHFISCPIRLNDSGGRVFVNADGLSINSYLRVEIYDEKFRRLPGYSADDCVPLMEPGPRQPVVWRNKETLDKFDHPIRIRVNYGGLRPEDIHVYAIYVSSS